MNGLFTRYECKIGTINGIILGMNEKFWGLNGNIKALMEILGGINGSLMGREWKYWGMNGLIGVRMKYYDANGNINL